MASRRREPMVQLLLDRADYLEDQARLLARRLPALSAARLAAHRMATPQKRRPPRPAPKRGH